MNTFINVRRPSPSSSLRAEARRPKLTSSSRAHRPSGTTSRAQQVKAAVVQEAAAVVEEEDVEEERAVEPTRTSRTGRTAVALLPLAVEVADAARREARRPSEDEVRLAAEDVVRRPSAEGRLVDEVEEVRRRRSARGTTTTTVRLDFLLPLLRFTLLHIAHARACRPRRRQRRQRRRADVQLPRARRRAHRHQGGRQQGPPLLRLRQAARRVVRVLRLGRRPGPSHRRAAGGRRRRCRAAETASDLGCASRSPFSIQASRALSDGCVFLQRQPDRSYAADADEPQRCQCDLTPKLLTVSKEGALLSLALLTCTSRSRAHAPPTCRAEPGARLLQVPERQQGRAVRLLRLGRRGARRRRGRVRVRDGWCASERERRRRRWRRVLQVRRRCVFSSPFSPPSSSLELSS